jgi:hypothetical protein
MLAALLLALVAGALAAGCGESSTTTTPVASAPASTTPTVTASTDTASVPSKPAAAPAGHHGRSALAKARARAAFQSLASAKPTHKLTPAQRAQLPVSDIVLASPAVRTTAAGSAIAREYTCDGADRSLPLRWKNIPPGTAEIAIFVLNTVPVDGKLFFDWAVTGLSPELEGLAAGQLPAGAISGLNGYGHTGYSICPPAGARETYVIAIYALPQHLAATPGFDPATLRAQALHTTRHTGLLIATYKRA